MQLNNRDSLDWLAETAANGESIVGRIIRERSEAKEAEARRARIERLCTLALWPALALATVAATAPLASIILDAYIATR